MFDLFDHFARVLTWKCGEFLFLQGSISVFLASGHSLIANATRVHVPLAELTGEAKPDSTKESEDEDGTHMPVSTASSYFVFGLFSHVSFSIAHVVFVLAFCSNHALFGAAAVLMLPCAVHCFL